MSTSNLTWKREKATGHHVGTLDGRKVARVRKIGNTWRWSYRGPRESRATIDEATLLKHAKKAVQQLHDAKNAQHVQKHGNEHVLHPKASGGTDDTRRRATEHSRQETTAGRWVGGADVETTPSGGGVRERQGPHILRAGDGSFLRGQPLEVESTPETMCDFREGERPSNQEADAC